MQVEFIIIFVLLIKSNQEILLDLADFALQEQPEDNYGRYFLGMV